MLCVASQIRVVRKRITKRIAAANWNLATTAATKTFCVLSEKLKKLEAEQFGKPPTTTTATRATVKLSKSDAEAYRKVVQLIAPAVCAVCDALRSR